MNPTALSTELNREPFSPLRLHLSDGRKLEIHDPMAAMISDLSVYVFNVRRGDRHIADDTQLISLRHIVSVERLEASASKG